jgi:NAD(P)-dependent dehydrogenase (short-subunit alcohol dehydrogenase family)
MPRVAVVTGATAGVGRATCRELARRGWSLGLLARGTERLDATAEEAAATGVAALALEVDVARADEVERAAAVIERELGPIDVWVNNAMTSVFGPFLEMSPEDFRRVTEVTYLGYVHGTMTALRRMVPRDRGVVIQVGSALAYRGIPLQSAYCGAKHAIRGFTDSIRTELLHEGSAVQLCAVHLPALNTPQFRWARSLLADEARPVPPIYQPEVAANAVAWVAEHPRREMLVGYPTVATVLANRFAPGLLDRYLGRTGYRSQTVDRPRDRARPDNLYLPVDGDPGAHGVFDDQARDRSLHLWSSKHRGALASVGVGVATIMTLLGARRR